MPTLAIIRKPPIAGNRALAYSADMSTPALECRALCKRYHDQIVLDGIDLALLPGESVGLVGVNGAGKTTLIKCLLDLCRPDTGEVRIFGSTATQPSARQHLAFLPERLMPPHYLTGEDYLRYQLHLRRQPYDPVAAADILATLGLENGALKKPVRLQSKGMTQKLGLAACLLTRAPLLILDEPASGLDPKARILLKQALQQARVNGKALFFSSHDLHDVAELCDRMAVLHQGNLRFFGSPQTFLERYGASSIEHAYLNCIG